MGREREREREREVQSLEELLLLFLLPELPVPPVFVCFHSHEVLGRTGILAVEEDSHVVKKKNQRNKNHEHPVQTRPNA